MAAAKVVSLKSRPWQVSHLCFAVPGIVEELRSVSLNKRHYSVPITLGYQVKKFDFTKFYEGLSKVAPGGDGSLLYYKAANILNDPDVQASLLMTLRAESTKAALAMAINARQNAYYAKYANQKEIIRVMGLFYTASNPLALIPLNPLSKPDMLAQLSGIAAQQDADLQFAYANNPPAPPLPNAAKSVVPTTSSVLKEAGPAEQIITNTDYGYRTPSYESAAQSYRAQISLLDQQFSQFMSTQNLSHLDRVFANELQSVDFNIMRLQVAFLNTVLMSPIDGIITGIYKNAGDWVQAGEPVIRIEDNSSVVLVGTVVNQGTISAGQTATVTTTLFDSANQTQIQGNVIAVRGNAKADDLWDVHLSCFNNAGLPPNYNFDYDNTSIAFV